MRGMFIPKYQYRLITIFDEVIHRMIELLNQFLYQLLDS